MKVEQNKLPRGQVELTIELSIDEYQPFLQQAAEEISKVKNIEGFRPGKASLGIVIQRVGKQEVWQQALEPAVHKTFVKTLEQQNLMTIGSPQINIIKLAPDNPVIYKAVISLLPAVELTDYSKIKVKAQPVEIKDTEPQKTLSDLQKSRAKESLVDRAARKGDKVEIDFETFMDRIPIDNGKQQKFPLVIGESTFIPGFEEQITGLKKNETKEFSLKFPENYHQKNLAGKLVDFKIKMQSVYQLDLPELNDQFAQSLGEFNNLADLKQKIKDNLKEQKDYQEKQRLEEELIDKIIAKSTFGEPPDLLIDSETKKMVEELEHNIMSQGLNFDDYLNHLKKTKEDLLLDFVPQAIKRVKAALVLREVAKKENIKAEEKDIDEEIQKTIQIYGDNPEIEKQINQKDYRDYLRNVLSARKVMEHLKSVMVEK